MSLAFSKRFASSLPPEDVLDSTSLTPLSAGLAGSDPLPVPNRRRHATKGEDASSVINNQQSLRLAIRRDAAANYSSRSLSFKIAR